MLDTQLSWSILLSARVLAFFYHRGTYEGRAARRGREGRTER